MDRASVPANQKILRSVWTFRIKKDPLGKIVKYKARFCADGRGQQHGISYFETYAPVVNWLSVRLLLILSVVHGWHSKSIDFRNLIWQG